MKERRAKSTPLPLLSNSFLFLMIMMMVKREYEVTVERIEEGNE